MTEQGTLSLEADHKIQPDAGGTGNQRLLWFLTRGDSITPLLSWDYLGIYRLSARVFDLKADGWDVRSKTAKRHNKYGEEITVAEYWIGRRGGPHNDNR
jgi:hypothetical protein